LNLLEVIGAIAILIIFSYIFGKIIDLIRPYLYSVLRVSLKESLGNGGNIFLYPIDKENGKWQIEYNYEPNGKIEIEHGNYLTCYVKYHYYLDLDTAKRANENRIEEIKRSYLKVSKRLR